jgi:uncharacterized protein (DUF433 family)
VIDWRACEDVERMPGQWLIRGTCIPAQAVIDNAVDGFTAEQIAAEFYEVLPVEPARRVIELAKKAAAQGVA